MKILSFSVFVLILFAFSCKNDKKEPTPGLPEGVIDLRDQYTVSTLTDPFDGSGGLAIDANGFIYVADFGSELSSADGTVVNKVDPVTGDVEIFAGGLDGPSGNDFGPDGYLYQSNIQGNYISKISPEGEVSRFVSTGVFGPVGIVIDSEGNAFICNCSRNTISRVTANGEVSTFSGGADFNCPNGITMDDLGNLYVVNFRNRNVVKVTTEGDAVVIATLPGGAGHVDFANGELYVVGRATNQIFLVSLEGDVSVIAGTSEPGTLDGIGSESTFYIPNGIRVSSDGNKIYVNDRLGETGGLNPVVVRVIERI